MAFDGFVSCFFSGRTRSGALPVLSSPGTHPTLRCSTQGRRAAQFRITRSLALHLQRQHCDRLTIWLCTLELIECAVVSSYIIVVPDRWGAMLSAVPISRLAEKLAVSRAHSHLTIDRLFFVLSRLCVYEPRCVIIGLSPSWCLHRRCTVIFSGRARSGALSVRPSPCVPPALLCSTQGRCAAQFRITRSLALHLHRQRCDQLFVRRRDRHCTSELVQRAVISSVVLLSI